jgi:hypothetical protein
MFSYLLRPVTERMTLLIRGETAKILKEKLESNKKI